MEKKLLIVGAGGHGQVAAEIAEDCGYTKIAFIDDNSDRAIGKISDLPKFTEDYKEAFVGIGNNRFRGTVIEQLKSYGYRIVTLVHPTAYISRSAAIGQGVLVEPKAIINTHSIIDSGSIISIGVIVDHNAVIGKNCHINSGAIVKAGASVADGVKIDAGQVVLGY